MGVSSSDGYCSFMIFNKNDLGEELPLEGMFFSSYRDIIINRL